MKLDGKRYQNDDQAPIFQKEFFAMNHKLLQGDIAYDALGGVITSTTAFRKSRHGWGGGAGSVTPLFNAYATAKSRQFSQELRYSGTVGRFDIQAGGYYQSDRLAPNTVLDFALPGLPTLAAYYNLSQRTKTYAAFADLTYHITDELSIEAGGRYVDITKRANQMTRAANILPHKNFRTSRAALAAANDPALNDLYGLFFGGPPITLTGLKLKESNFQPQVVVQHKFNSGHTLYAKYVKGFKAGGYDFLYAGPDPMGAPFDAEEAQSYEAGLKGRFDNTLDYSLTVFRTDFKDLQLSQYQTTSFLVSNAGKARSQGIEFDLTWAAARGLTVSANGIYLDAKFRSFPNATCDRASLEATAAGDVCRRDISGLRTPYSSKWSGTIRADYEQPVSDAYTLSGGFALLGRTSFTPGTEKLLSQNGYVQVDARVAFGAHDDRWKVTLYSTNLTDKQYKLEGDVVSGTPGGLFAALSEGRQIGLRLNLKY